MLPEDWDSGFGRTIGVFYNGDGIQEQDSRGRRITDDSFIMAFNAHDDAVDFYSLQAQPALARQHLVDAGLSRRDDHRTGTRLMSGSAGRVAQQV